jgi:hypothetical protein
MLCGYLWTKFHTLVARIWIALAALTQLAPGIAFAWVFAGGGA